MKNNKYSLLYKIKFENKDEGYTFEDSKDYKNGLTDAVYMVSILRHEDGSLSTQAVCYDGENKEEPNTLPSKELFFIMFCLADKLSEDADIPNVLRYVLKAFCDVVRKYKNPNSPSSSAPEDE